MKRAHQAPPGPEQPLPAPHRPILRGSLVGAGVSLAVHILAMIFAALVFIARPGPPGEGQGEGVELAVFTDTELTALRDQAEPNPFSGAELATSASAEVDPFPSTTFELGLETLEVSGSPLTGAGRGAAGEGEGLELAGGAGGAASFFGVEARGLRFIYIVDVSASMGGPKIVALQRELTNSIAALPERASFAVYFFASETRPLGGSPRWQEAKERPKQYAATEIRALQPFGGTDPMPAFEAAFAMKPRADAIYFMTDGLFPDAVAPAVGALNKRGRVVPIHCISFVSPESQSLMTQIARQSGGTYTHVDRPAVP